MSMGYRRITNRQEKHMQNIYKHSPVVAAMVASLPALKRGNMAAKSLAKQRKYLAAARKHLGSKTARYYLALWAEERQLWAHLVGKVAA